MLNRKKLVVDGIEPTITRSRANRENRSTSSTSPSYWIVVIYRYGCTKQVGCSWNSGLGEQATRCWSPLTDCAHLYILLRRLSQTDQTWAQTSVQKSCDVTRKFFFCRSEGSFNEWWMKLSSKLNPNVGISVLLAKKILLCLRRRNEQNVFAQK